MNRITRLLLAIVTVLTISSVAQAEPILQLYIEGSTYDTGTETWVINLTSGSPIRLWAIGNVSGGGGKGRIDAVKLSIAYASTDTPTISLVSSTTGGLGGFTDPSTPGAAVFQQISDDGELPLLGDGSTLPTHGEYGPGTRFTEYLLGDFTLSDSPRGDFIDSFPAPGALGFQINVYEISISGTGVVHFDLYDHYYSKKKAQAVFAPFSHDGEGDGCCTTVPEPASFVLIATGLGALAFGRRRRS